MRWRAARSWSRVSCDTAPARDGRPGRRRREEVEATEASRGVSGTSEDGLESRDGRPFSPRACFVSSFECASSFVPASFKVSSRDAGTPSPSVPSVFFSASSSADAFAFCRLIASRRAAARVAARRRSARSSASQSSIIPRSVRLGTTRERFRRRFVEGSVCWCSSHCISADRS